MIVPNAKDRSSAPATQILELPPPTYDEAHPSTNPASSSLVPTSASTAALPSSSRGTPATTADYVESRPTNYYTQYSENRSIKGHYHIDPLMKLPASLLGQNTSREDLATRHNLSLKSENSSIDVAIKLADTPADVTVPADTKPRRTWLHAESENGRLTIRLDAPATAAPFLFEIKGENGAINLQIPRTYRGVLKTRTVNGRLTCSDALTAESTFVSDGEKHARNFYIGELPREEFDETLGNEIVIRTENGSIKIRYLDEIVEEKPSSCCIM